MNKRKLSREEKDLWRLAAEGTLPLKKPRSNIQSTIDRKDKVEKRNIDTNFRSKIGPSAPRSVATAIPAPLVKLNVKMDHKSYAKMRRGKLIPEARIDLHGLTVAKAHPVLTHFIQSSYVQRLRLVLIITGKGQSNDQFDFVNEGRGILRKQVPQWLSLTPLSRLVLQVQQSHARHGGAGALYVYLKKNKLDI